MLNKLVAVASFVGVMFLSGCAAVNKAPDHLDAQAKQFQANPEYSQVYVYRNETFGAAVSMPVSVNGKEAGTTGPKSFFKFLLPEGKHVIKSQGEESVLEISTQKNKTYFVWQEVKMGAFSAGSELQIVDEEKGKAGVLECSLIKGNFN